MKPTSIIFLLVSLVIILVGWLTCHNAEARAEEDGVQIFASSIDGDKNSVVTFEFDPSEIYNKIELVVDEADVYVYGGYSEPKMELINFNEGSYRMTTANRNITVDTTVNLMAIIRFWESGFTFRGLRDYVRRTDSDAAAAKRINLFLPSDGDINIININLDHGNVYFSNFDTSIDVNLELGNGDAAFSSFKTSSALNANLTSGELYLNNASIGIFEAVIESGNITAENLAFDSINIVGSVGSAVNVSLMLAPDMKDFTMSLSARRGAITLYDKNVGTEYSSGTISDTHAMITVASGDIIIGRSNAAVKPPVNSGDNSGETSAADSETNNQ